MPAFHLLCDSFLSVARGRKKRGSENRVSKQRRYAVSKQKTMVYGLAAVCLVLSALKDREGETEWVKGLEQRKVDHHSH